MTTGSPTSSGDITTVAPPPPLTEPPPPGIPIGAVSTFSVPALEHAPFPPPSPAAPPPAPGVRTKRKSDADEDFVPEDEGDEDDRDGDDESDGDEGDDDDEEDYEDEDEEEDDEEESGGRDPKRPRTAYQLFIEEKRLIVKAQHPEMKPAEVRAQLSSLWRNVSNQERANYDGKAALDKQRYKAELASKRARKSSGRGRGRGRGRGIGPGFGRGFAPAPQPPLSTSSHMNVSPSALISAVIQDPAYRLLQPPPPPPLQSPSSAAALSGLYPASAGQAMHPGRPFRYVLPLGLVQPSALSQPLGSPAAPAQSPPASVPQVAPAGADGIGSPISLILQASKASPLTGFATTVAAASMPAAAMPAIVGQAQQPGPVRPHIPAMTATPVSRPAAQPVIKSIPAMASPSGDPTMLPPICSAESSVSLPNLPPAVAAAQPRMQLPLATGIPTSAPGITIGALAGASEEGQPAPIETSAGRGRGRGRGRKRATQPQDDSEPPKQKRKPGRPRKNPAPADQTAGQPPIGTTAPRLQPGLRPMPPVPPQYRQALVQPASTSIRDIDGIVYNVPYMLDPSKEGELPERIMDRYCRICFSIVEDTANSARCTCDRHFHLPCVNLFVPPVNGTWTCPIGCKPRRALGRSTIPPVAIPAMSSAATIAAMPVMPTIQAPVAPSLSAPSAFGIPDQQAEAEFFSRFADADPDGGQGTLSPGQFP